MSAGDVEQQAFAVRAQTQAQGCLQVAALGAHTGDEEPQVGGEAADAGERLGLGGAHHHADVVAGVPGLRQAGDVLMQGQARLQRQVLQVGCAGVGSLAQEENAFLLVGEEGVDGILAKVGVEGDGVDAQLLEGGFCIGLGGRGNVAALGIQDDLDHRAESVGFDLHGGDDLFQCRPAVGAIEFEKGGVGFEGGSIRSGGLDDADAKIPRGRGGGGGQV